jgi:hypothetical protein
MDRVTLVVARVIVRVRMGIVTAVAVQAIVHVAKTRIQVTVRKLVKIVARQLAADVQIVRHAMDVVVAVTKNVVAVRIAPVVDTTIVTSAHLVHHVVKSVSTCRTRSFLITSQAMNFLAQFVMNFARCQMVSRFALHVT